MLQVQMYTATRAIKTWGQWPAGLHPDDTELGVILVDVPDELRAQLQQIGEKTLAEDGLSVIVAPLPTPNLYPEREAVERAARLHALYPELAALLGGA